MRYAYHMCINMSSMDYDAHVVVVVDVFEVDAEALPKAVCE